MLDKEFEMITDRSKAEYGEGSDKRKMWYMSDVEVNKFLQSIDPTALFIRFVLDHDSDSQYIAQTRGIEYRLADGKTRFMPFSNLNWIKYCATIDNVDLQNALQENIKLTSDVLAQTTALESLVNMIVSAVYLEGRSPKGQLSRIEEILTSVLDIEKIKQKAQQDALQAKN